MTLRLARRVRITRTGHDQLVLAIGNSARWYRIYISEDQAQHLSNRLQSFAKGAHGSEIVITEE